MAPHPPLQLPVPWDVPGTLLADVTNDGPIQYSAGCLLPPSSPSGSVHGGGKGEGGDFGRMLVHRYGDGPSECGVAGHEEGGGSGGVGGGGGGLASKGEGKANGSGGFRALGSGGGGGQQDEVWRRSEL